MVESNKVVNRLLAEEVKRQKRWIELIASENYPSKSVREIVWSMFMAKYAEWYPVEKILDWQSWRYYGWCEVVDKLENETRRKALEMFWLHESEYHVNVQPHSWSQANEAALMTVLNPWDKILSFQLDHGGHLSHWMKLNTSWRIYNITHYWVDEKTKELDYDSIMKQAKEVKPKLIICWASAYSRKIDFVKFREIADEVWAYLMADIAHIAWLIVAWLHNSPFDANCDIITSTTHKTLRWNRGWIVFVRLWAIDWKDIARILDTRVFPWVQWWPLMNEIAGKLVAFTEACDTEFTAYQLEVKNNAKILSKKLEERFTNSEYLKEARILTGWTDNHLVLLDFSDVEWLNWKIVQDILWEYGITVNKNLLPWDPESPQITSWIRIWTPAITTRWADKKFMETLAEIIVMILDKYIIEEVNWWTSMESIWIKSLIDSLVWTLKDEWIDCRELID